MSYERGAIKSSSPISSHCSGYRTTFPRKEAWSLLIAHRSSLRCFNFFCTSSQIFDASDLGCRAHPRLRLVQAPAWRSLRNHRARVQRKLAFPARSGSRHDYGHRSSHHYISPPRTVHTGLRIRVEQQCEIWMQIPAQYPMQLPHCLTSQPASASLVSLGGIGETITQDDASGCEARFNHLGNVLCTRGEHQGHLRARVEASGTGIQQHLAVFSPVEVPPGSRVSTTLYPAPRSAAASFRICVLLPLPSRPSNVMNFPRRDIQRNNNSLQTVMLWQPKQPCRDRVFNCTPSVSRCYSRNICNTVKFLPSQSGSYRNNEIHESAGDFLCLPLFILWLGGQCPHCHHLGGRHSSPRKIFHASLKIPAAPSEFHSYYPKWIPGEHAPDGPVVDLAGLFFKANGQTLKWRRDLLDGFTIHVDVPAGVNQIDAELDFLSPATLESGFSAGSSATDKLAVISWNQVLLYPKGWKSDDINYAASLKLPEGWKFGTPLPIASQSGNEIHFATASLTTLVDSPVITGEFLKIVPLSQDPLTEMDIAADSAAALEAPAEVWDHYKSLVEQAQKLFGAHHYRDYHFLYTLSDHVAHFGLEHHESDDSRVGERDLVDETGANYPRLFSPTNMCIVGTGSIAAPTIWRRPTTSSPCRMTCSGCMKA